MGTNATNRTWRDVIRARLFVAAACLATWVIGIEARLVFLQVYRHDEYVQRAEKQQKRTVDVPARRGEIIDRNGQMLALSVDAESIYAVPRAVEDPAATIAKICGAIDGCSPEDTATYLKRLGQKRDFVYLARRLSPDVAAKVTALELPGISLMSEQRRFYPNRELAAHVLGYVGLDGEGLGGIEASWNSKIGGQKGAALVEVDGRHHVFTKQTKRSPVAGMTVELTIDHVIQHITERELHAAVVANGAMGGTALVIDPNTGEVLALANEPTFNPNAYADASEDSHINRGTQTPYEPGSTFKLVTASAAIEEQAFKTDELIDVSAGAIHIGPRVVKDVHASGVLSFTDVIVKSSNVGAIKIGMRLGAERMSRYVRRFGFGTRMCPDLFGETAGRVPAPGRWSDSTLASVSMGYEVGVTPLQMAAAVSSVANGGLLVQPRLVRALRRGDQRGAVVTNEPRRTIQPETAAELLAIMEQVVARGTATAAAIPGYTVAGKTGTAAKIVNGHYSKTDYYSSFIGFVPSRAPAFAIIVVIDAPHRGAIFGGAVAAPVFKKIAEPVLRYLHVAPTVNPVPPVVVTAVADQPAPEIVPASNRAPGGRFDVITGSPAVPDVRGLGAREAIRRLARLGLVATVVGDGIVTGQDPSAGLPLEPGTVCRLTLERITIPPVSRPPTS